MQLLLSAAGDGGQPEILCQRLPGPDPPRPNMDTLVALGSAASFGYSAFALFAMSGALARGDAGAAMSYLHGLYFESAAMILTLITVGKLLEARSKGKTTDALRGLMQLPAENRPAPAGRRRDGGPRRAGKARGPLRGPARGEHPRGRGGLRGRQRGG